MQLEVLLETVEAIEDAPGAPKNKERRKKRKQEALGATKALDMTTEKTPVEGSPEKSISKRRERSHKDSKPNNAHSCVGDNVSKVIIDPHLIRVALKPFILCQ